MRKLKSAGMIALCGAAVALALVPLVSILWMVIAKGAHGLSWDFFTKLPAPVGTPGGGVGNAVLGTVLIVALASAMGIPLGLGVGLYLAEEGGGRLGAVVRFTAEVLSGVPSIVLGMVAYALVVLPMRSFSALAGAVALALLMIPTLARAAEELIRLVPRSLREASLALGIPGWRTSIKVVLRSATPGLITACLLAIARAAGETAPLLFTSLFSQYWNVSPGRPTASLTVEIFDYAVSPYPDWQQKAWTSALVLLLLIALLGVVARLIARGRSGARG